MPFTYKKKAAPAPKAAEPPKAAAPAQFGAVPMSALRDAMKSPASMGGHKVDLASAMREKMENAFGMDFGALSVYESPMVAAAGANAVADGSTIAFAPGKFDQSSQGGQALLGHELSHIAAQARGEVRGGGFLDNGALEARADREGAQAAAGESVYNGDFAAPSASLAPVAAAPMQADRSRVDPKAFAEFVKKQRLEKDLDRLMAFKQSGISVTNQGDVEENTIPAELIMALGGDKMRAAQVAKQESDWSKDWMANNATEEVYEALKNRRTNLMKSVNAQYNRQMPVIGGNRNVGASPEERKKAQAMAMMRAGNSDEGEDLVDYQQIVREIALAPEKQADVEKWASFITNERNSQVDVEKDEEGRPIMVRPDPYSKKLVEKTRTNETGAMYAKTADIMEHRGVDNNPITRKVHSIEDNPFKKATAYKEYLSLRDKQDRRKKAKLVANLRERGVIE